MADQNSNSENQQRSQEQYDMLKRCSDKKDMAEWNEWRKKNPNTDINLSGANLEGFFLKGANFIRANVQYKPGEEINYTGQICLEKANFKSTNLEGVWFGHAILKRAVFQRANASGVDFEDADLEEANISVANLQGCRFCHATLKNTKIIASSLNGSNFTYANMIGCQIRASVTDSATNFRKVDVNKFSRNCKYTDFSDTPLGSVRVDPGTRQLLEYNIQRMNWEEWYKNHRLLKWLVRPFWLMSDYGLSTVSIIFTFFGLAVVFAGIYCLCALANPPGIVHGLIDGKEGLVPAWLLPFRSIYFSIVTMTTLGFGDMHANCQSFWGHLLLTFQVLLGYVLLGALVTRFAVLFTAGGPAGRFADERGEKEAKKSSAKT